jgi:protein O-mannosyl-transferase
VPGTREPVGVWLSRVRRIVVRPELGLGLVLIAVTGAVYARTASFGFVVFDDPTYVSENPHVLNGLSLSGIRWAFSKIHDCNWIPLTWLSLELDATIYGRWAGGYHVTNILLHVANVLLAFAALNGTTGKTWRSAFVAALFAVHPLHVESVAWISERKDVLSIFFGLLSLCAYVRSTVGRRRLWLLTAFVCLLGSLSSKQTLVTLPFVFLLLDFWPLGRFAHQTHSQRDDAGLSDRRFRIKPLVIEKIPFFALSAAFCAVALLAQWWGHSVRNLAEMPLSSRMLNAILAYGLYLEKACFPFGLAIFYPHPGARIGLTGVACTLAVLAGTTALTIANVRRWPFLLVGWLWFLGTLIPMIGLVQVGLQQMADRYAYFPSLGLYIAIAWLAPTIASTSAVRRRVLPILAGGIVAICAGTAFVQVGYWRDGVTLMHHALEVTGDNAFGRSVLGDALLAESRTDEALVEYQKSIELAPRDSFCQFHLGWVFQRLKRFDAAADQYRTALQINDRMVEAHVGLGLVLCEQHQYIAAKQEFCHALEIEADNKEATGSLAALCRTLGEWDESTEYAERALTLDDTLLYCHRVIAFNLIDQGRLDEAIVRLQKATAAAPAYEDVRADLDRVLALRDGRSDAIRQ